MFHLVLVGTRGQVAGLSGLEAINNEDLAGVWGALESADKRYLTLCHFPPKIKRSR